MSKSIEELRKRRGYNPRRKADETRIYISKSLSKKNPFKLSIKKVGEVAVYYGCFPTEIDAKREKEELLKILAEA